MFLIFSSKIKLCLTRNGPVLPFPFFLSLLSPHLDKERKTNLTKTPSLVTTRELGEIESPIGHSQNLNPYPKVSKSWTVGGGSLEHRVFKLEGEVRRSSRQLLSRPCVDVVHLA